MCAIFRATRGKSHTEIGKGHTAVRPERSRRASKNCRLHTSDNAGDGFTGERFAMSEQAGHDTPIYLNHTQPLGDRVGDLLARMTLAEKISQMQHGAAAIPRL